MVYLCELIRLEDLLWRVQDYNPHLVFDVYSLDEDLLPLEGDF